MGVRVGFFYVGLPMGLLVVPSSGYSYRSFGEVGVEV